MDQKSVSNIIIHRETALMNLLKNYVRLSVAGWNLYRMFVSFVLIKKLRSSVQSSTLASKKIKFHNSTNIVKENISLHSSNA